jgi:thioredoxin-related protein
MHMKKLFGIFFAITLLLNVRAESQWLTNLDTAKQQARKDNKVMLLDFTGSDWCGYCIKLKRNVFDTPEFTKFAEKNLVLVEVDFPIKKKQSDEVKKANDKLGTKYEVNGYPTIVVLNSQGEKLGALEGYNGETPSEYIAKLEKILARKKST